MPGSPMSGSLSTAHLRNRILKAFVRCVILFGCHKSFGLSMSISPQRHWSMRVPDHRTVRSLGVKPGRKEETGTSAMSALVILSTIRLRHVFDEHEFNRPRSGQRRLQLFGAKVRSSMMEPRAVMLREMGRTGKVEMIALVI